MGSLNKEGEKRLVKLMLSSLQRSNEYLSSRKTNFTVNFMHLCVMVYYLFYLTPNVAVNVHVYIQNKHIYIRYVGHICTERINVDTGT